MGDTQFHHQSKAQPIPKKCAHLLTATKKMGMKKRHISKERKLLQDGHLTVGCRNLFFASISPQGIQNSQCDITRSLLNQRQTPCHNLGDTNTTHFFLQFRTGGLRPSKPGLWLRVARVCWAERPLKVCSASGRRRFCWDFTSSEKAPLVPRSSSHSHLLSPTFQISFLRHAILLAEAKAFNQTMWDLSGCHSFQFSLRYN